MQKHFVTDLLKNEPQKTYSYHTLDHTLEMVKNAVYIGTKLTNQKMKWAFCRWQPGFMIFCYNKTTKDMRKKAPR
jgi:hypothetical protein